jgi:hypothetical protein
VGSNEKQVQNQEDIMGPLNAVSPLPLPSVFPLSVLSPISGVLGFSPMTLRPGREWLSWWRRWEPVSNIGGETTGHCHRK